MWFPNTWQEVAGLSVVVAFIWAIGYFLLRSKLVSDFVPRPELMGLHKVNVDAIGELHEDHRKIKHRIANIEMNMQQLATRIDLQKVGDKVNQIDRNIGELTVAIQNNNNEVKRNFEMMRMLVRSQIPDQAGE